MAGDIVPIELGLTDGNSFTLWAPRWRDGDDEWEAFLGLDEDLYVLPGVAELAAFIRNDDENDLADHPAWSTVVGLQADELVPDERHSYDLVGVPELAAEDPTPEVIAELEAAASAEDEDEPADDDIEIVDVAAGTSDDESEDDDSDEEDADEDDLDDEDDEDVDDEDDFWASVGIDPIRITTGAGEYLTLRCYLGDEPVFLGAKGKIFVFSSPRSLTRFLATNNSHDLADLSTFEDVRSGATDGSLEYDVIADNTYVLPGLADDIADGPRRMDRTQLDLAVELFTDAADYAGDDSVGEALASTTPLGWFVDYAVNPDPKRMAPSAPFDNEAEAWRALEHDFEDRLEKKG